MPPVTVSLILAVLALVLEMVSILVTKLQMPGWIPFVVLCLAVMLIGYR